MPDPALSAAIAEAYATADPGQVILHTLELWHPAFTAPIRVVRDTVALDARIEAGAARDAGNIVTFVAYAFDLTLPEQAARGVPECVIEIDNVGRDILAQLDLASTDPRPVVAIYRAYLSDALEDGPENDPPVQLQLKSVSATALRIRAVAGFRDLENLRFPRQDYDLERFPGLQP